MRTARMAMALVCCSPLAGLADATLEDAQRALNAHVMAAPFNPGDARRAQEWAAEAKRQNVIPEQHPPPYWQPGWTCASLTTYVGYVYGDYRNCIYFQAYYGRYWR